MKVFKKAFGISSFVVGFVAFALVATGYIAQLIKYYVPYLTSGGTIDAALLVIAISNAVFALLCVAAAILALVNIIRLCLNKEINEIRSVSRSGSLYTAGFFVSIFAISILIPVLSHVIGGTPLALTVIDYVGNALPFVALILFSVGSFLRKENRIGGGIVFAIGALIMVAISVLTISTSNTDELFATSEIFITISTIGTLIVSLLYFILASVYVFLPEGENEEEVEAEPEVEDRYLAESEEQPVEKVRKDEAEAVAPVVISEPQEEKVEEAPKAEEPVKEEKVEEAPKAEEPVKEEKVEEVKAEEAKPAPKAVKKAEEKPAKKVEAKPAEKKEAPKKAESKPAEKKEPAKKAEPKPAKKVEAKPVEKKEAPKKAEAKPASKEEKSSAADKTRVYHVVKREKDNKWEVKFAGGEKAIKLFNTQKEAIEYSKVMAENQGGTYLVHNSKGANKGRIQKK